MWPRFVLTKERVHLGPFQEDFRRYLLNLAPFPTHAALTILVRETSDVSRSSRDPGGGRQGRMHVFTFSMPGLYFVLFVGKHLEASYKRVSLVHRQNNPIFVSSIAESYIRRGIFTALP